MGLAPLISPVSSSGPRTSRPGGGTWRGRERPRASGPMCLSITSSPILPSTTPSSAISLSCAAPPRVRAPFFSTGVRFCASWISSGGALRSSTLSRGSSASPTLRDGSSTSQWLNPPSRASAGESTSTTYAVSSRTFVEWGWPARVHPRTSSEGTISHLTKRHLPKPLPPDVDALFDGGTQERTQLSQPGTPPGAQDGLARRGALPPGMGGSAPTETPDGRYSLRVPLGEHRSQRVIPMDREPLTSSGSFADGPVKRPLTWDPDTCRSG